ncbi:MAG: fructose 1,6-bisphosphatase, partial [Candidatus Bathyarchaeia archaeon]
MGGKRVTVSLIKADVGSVAGHYSVHPEQIEVAKACLERARNEGLIEDFFV